MPDPASPDDDSSRWQLIRRLLEQAFAQPRESRSAWLDRACGDDADLRRRMAAILTAGESPVTPDERTPAVEPLERTAAEDAPSLASTRTADARTEPGARIGPYRLLQKVGEGGMGEVWLAEQNEPVRRRVALKVIKQGMDTRQVITRFEAERQALAMMDHPCFAKVFDAGSTSTGRPYFVMEYVAGIPITEHCDRSRLTTRERLDLFMQVCQGVQHAHQKAILHRDLKPSNVLVSVQDGTGVPKIIDFGVAKATAQPLWGPGLDHDEGAREGPIAPVRITRRAGVGHREASQRPACPGGAAEPGVPRVEVHAATQGRCSGGGIGRGDTHFVRRADDGPGCAYRA